jgi:hypothetical protein
VAVRASRWFIGPKMMVDHGRVGDAKGIEWGYSWHIDEILVIIYIYTRFKTGEIMEYNGYSWVNCPTNG